MLVARFQKEEGVGVFLGGIRSAGQGIMLTAARKVIFVELDWSPAVMLQAEDRAHRIGLHWPIAVDYLFFTGTLDGHVANIIRAKFISQDALLRREVGTPVAPPGSEGELTLHLSQLRVYKNKLERFVGLLGRRTERMQGEALQKMSAGGGFATAELHARQLMFVRRRRRLCEEMKLIKARQGAVADAQVELHKLLSAAERSGGPMAVPQALAQVLPLLEDDDDFGEGAPPR